MSKKNSKSTKSLYKQLRLLLAITTGFARCNSFISRVQNVQQARITNQSQIYTSYVGSIQSSTDTNFEKINLQLDLRPSSNNDIYPIKAILSVKVNKSMLNENSTYYTDSFSEDQKGRFKLEFYRKFYWSWGVSASSYASDAVIESLVFHMTTQKFEHGQWEKPGDGGLEAMKLKYLNLSLSIPNQNISYGTEVRTYSFEYTKVNDIEETLWVYAAPLIFIYLVLNPLISFLMISVTTLTSRCGVIKSLYPFKNGRLDLKNINLLSLMDFFPYLVMTYFFSSFLSIIVVILLMAGEMFAQGITIRICSFILLKTVKILSKFGDDNISQIVQKLAIEKHIGRKRTTTKSPKGPKFDLTKLSGPKYLKAFLTANRQKIEFLVAFFWTLLCFVFPATIPYMGAHALMVAMSYSLILTRYDYPSFADLLCTVGYFFPFFARFIIFVYVYPAIAYQFYFLDSFWQGLWDGLFDIVAGSVLIAVQWLLMVCIVDFFLLKSVLLVDNKQLVWGLGQRPETGRRVMLEPLNAQKVDLMVKRGKGKSGFVAGEEGDDDSNDDGCPEESFVCSSTRNGSYDLNWVQRLGEGLQRGGSLEIKYRAAGSREALKNSSKMVLGVGNRFEKGVFFARTLIDFEEHPGLVAVLAKQRGLVDGREVHCLFVYHLRTRRVVYRSSYHLGAGVLDGVYKASSTSEAAQTINLDHNERRAMIFVQGKHGQSGSVTLHFDEIDGAASKVRTQKSLIISSFIPNSSKKFQKIDFSNFEFF